MVVPEVSKNVVRILRSKDLRVVWELVDSTDIIIVGISMEHATKALSEIRKYLVSFKYDSLPVDRNVLENGIVKSLSRRHQGLVKIEIGDNCIEVATVAFLKKDVDAELKDFIDKHSQVSAFMEVDAGRFGYVLVFQPRDFQTEEDESTVEIDIIHEHKTKGFVVTGEKHKCRNTIAGLRLLVDSVLERVEEVDWPGFEMFVHNQSIKNKLTQLQVESKCLIKVITPEKPINVQENDPQMSCLFSCKIGGCSLSYCKGDITERRSDDVLVVFVPETLDHNLDLGMETAREGIFLG